MTFAQNAPTEGKIRYLFQSFADANGYILAENNEINILYINENCLSCFKRIDQIRQMNTYGRFIVVTTASSMNGLKNTLEKTVSPSVLKYIYFDPGRRFESAVKPDKSEASFVRYSFGKLQGNYKFTLSNAAKNPYELKIWN